MAAVLLGLGSAADQLLTDIVKPANDSNYRRSASPDALPGGFCRRTADEGGGAQPFDPEADLFRAGFQGRAVDDEARADIGDVLDLDEAVGPQRRPRLHQVDDMPAQPEERGKLDRAV